MERRNKLMIGVSILAMIVIVIIAGLHAILFSPEETFGSNQIHFGTFKAEYHSGWMSTYWMTEPIRGGGTNVCLTINDYIWISYDDFGGKTKRNGYIVNVRQNWEGGGFSSGNKYFIPEEDFFGQTIIITITRGRFSNTEVWETLLLSNEIPIDMRDKKIECIVDIEKKEVILKTRNDEYRKSIPYEWQKYNVKEIKRSGLKYVDITTSNKMFHLKIKNLKIVNDIAEGKQSYIIYNISYTSRYSKELVLHCPLSICEYLTKHL